VAPDDWSVMAPSTTPELTLTACTPRFSASNRLVVHATLVRSKLAGPADPTAPSTGATPQAAVRAETTGLAGDQGNWTPALWWGGAVVAAALAVWMVARRQRRYRWLAYGAGGAGVLVVLFFFFGAVSPLLPASF
jgi:sortase A